MNKYPGQVCQDDKINEDFNKLHNDIVNSIIKFCKDNNLEINEVCIGIDGMKESIPHGEWMACTDSSFSMYATEEKPFLWSI